MKALDLTKLTDQQVKDVAAKYEAKGMTDEDQYIALAAEIIRRSKKTLSIEKTITAIRSASQAGQMLSYGDLTSASGLKWSAKIRTLTNEHLENVARVARQRGWPMITAIVVNKNQMESGTMDEVTLVGFSDCARRLGWEVADARAFLAGEQKATALWARTGA
jgi:hypothetical protein